jgi:PhnB protein
MSGKTKPIPDGYHSVTPYLLIRGASDAMAFYSKAFDAVEILRLTMPDGKIAHAEIRIGNSHVMLADEHPDMDFLGPQSRGGTTVSLMIYVEDVDTVYARALEAGGVELKPLSDQFYGDRSGTLTDPWGHVWTVATHVEDISQDEIERRFESFCQ